MIITANHSEMRTVALAFIPRKSTIVEVGCSSGNFAELIKDTEHRYIGVDIQSDKINEARKKLPEMNFVNCDITKNLYIVERASTFISFQCLEHIKDDKKVINAISFAATVIFSVPNREYKGHIRWYELEGWKKRFEPYIAMKEVITIQHPKKPNNRSFLFKGIRNNESN